MPISRHLFWADGRRHNTDTFAYCIQSNRSASSMSGDDHDLVDDDDDDHDDGVVLHDDHHHHHHHHHHHESSGRAVMPMAVRSALLIISRATLAQRPGRHKTQGSWHLLG